MKEIENFDKHSLESLFRDHYTGLCRFALSYVKQDEVAKEIVQDAFVSLWEKRQTLDMSKPVKSYLSATVRNKCLNHLRDHKKFSRDLLAIENLHEDTLFDQSDKLVEQEINEKIASGISGLPEKCREVFLLSRYENLKYQQIADKLQISVKTVETQMSKALQHMRIHLSEYLPMMLLFMLIWQYCAVSPLKDAACRVFTVQVFTMSPFHHFAIFLPGLSG